MRPLVLRTRALLAVPGTVVRCDGSVTRVAIALLGAGDETAKSGAWHRTGARHGQV